MSLENIFPNKEQFDTMNSLLASIASNQGTGIKINNFADIQRVVRLGLAQKVFAVGEQFVAEKEKTISASVGDSTGITSADVDMVKFITAVGTAHEGAYETHFDGAGWLKEDGTPIILADYGITYTGTPVEGDHIVITETTTALTHDIVDFDKHTPKNSHYTHTLDLLMHDVYAYGTIPFSPAQLLCYFVNGLPAGKYRFTLDHARYGNGTEYDGTYMFEITQAIPAKGGFRHTNIGGWKSSYAKADVIGNYLTTYNPTTTGGAALESNRPVAEWDGDEDCVDLGTFTAQSRTYYTEALSITIGGTTYTGNRNFTERNAYGSNRWRDSVYRQWLNSDAAAVPSSDTSTISNWWKPATVFDRVPGGAKLAGYLYGMDVDFVKAIGEVAVKTVLHPCDRVGSETFDITYDKVFLASRKNIFGTDEFSGLSEGELFEYFRNATNADRIKYQSGTARYWWLRTPHSGYAYYVRGVTTDGALSGYAYNAGGGVPACCII